MLVSKTKPCKSKYKQFIRRNCRWLIKTVIVYLMVYYYLDNRSNSRANTCTTGPTHGGLYLLDKTPITFGFPVSHSNLSNRMASAGDRSFKFLPYQLSMVGYGPTMALTGDGELGFDSGEGA